MTIGRKRVLVPLTMIAAAAVAFTGCLGGDDDGGQDNAQPAQGGALRVAQRHDITSFDQFQVVDVESIQAISLITEPLFKTDSEGNVQPWLAADTKVSGNGTTYAFTLQQGVEFSNGEPLTADDVKFTIDQVRKTEQWGFLFAAIESVSAPRDDQVVVKLSAPSASLRADLALFATGVVPEDFGGASQSEFANEPVGTGPFVLDQWDKGTAVTLERNPEYWRDGEPLLDSVELVGVPNDNSRVTQLRGGQLDVASSPPWPQVEGLEQAGLAVGLSEPARVDALVLNATQAPFDDPGVREAVSLALDRQSIVDASLAGHGEVAQSFLAPSVPLYAPSLPNGGERDVSRAQQLVQAAGADGAAVTMIVPSGDAVQSTLAQVAQENLGEIGLDVTLRTLDKSAALEQIQSGDYTAGVSNLSSDIQDPSELAAAYVGTAGFFTNVDTERVGELAAQAAATQAESKRADLYAELQRAAVVEYGFVPVQVEPWAYASQEAVTGLTVTPTGLLDLSGVGLAPGS